jgi:exodeoxyribonuclease VII large subunit
MRPSIGTVPSLPVLSVSQLAGRIRASLEDGFAVVWVAGEISNLRIPPSGHFYFSLKDERSQISAVMFRSASRFLEFLPKDGMEVVVQGRIGLYEQRGDLQIYAEKMDPLGLGGIQLALAQLKERLQAEGLFDAERKRPLPAWPRTVGVVTALTGAVVHDIVTTLRSRMPSVRILVRPVRVQGDQAPADIVGALGDLATQPQVDVVIVGRGGGSLEDLWAFNDERVVRAMADAATPVVSAVGHETDFTLADLVADVRAPTPTAAAALVVPDARELARRIAVVQAALSRGFRGQLDRRRDRLSGAKRRLRDPRQSLATQRLRVDELAERGRRALEGIKRLAEQRCRATTGRLHAVSPLAVLRRGYSIVQRDDDGQVIRRSQDLIRDETLRVTFAEGSARVRVEDRRD